jgi:hypothetical protein
MTLAELDRIRNESTAAKNELRDAQAGEARGVFADPRDLYPLRVRVRETEAAADRAVLRWIAQGCREETRP